MYASRLHAEQTVLELESGKHVLCEVPAATTISEWRQIVNAVNKSGQKYMLAENSCYSDMHLTWRSTVEDGNLGKIIYAEAEHVHDCRQLMKNDDGTLKPGVPVGHRFNTAHIVSGLCSS